MDKYNQIAKEYILFFPLDRSSVLPNRYFFPGRSHILLSGAASQLEVSVLLSLRLTVQNLAITFQGPHCAEVSFGESSLRGIPTRLITSRTAERVVVSDLFMCLIRRLISQRLSL